MQSMCKHPDNMLFPQWFNLVFFFLIAHRLQGQMREMKEPRALICILSRLAPPRWELLWIAPLLPSGVKVNRASVLPSTARGDDWRTVGGAALRRRCCMWRCGGGEGPERRQLCEKWENYLFQMIKKTKNGDVRRKTGDLATETRQGGTSNTRRELAKPTDLKLPWRTNTRPRETRTFHTRGQENTGVSNQGQDRWQRDTGGKDPNIKGRQKKRRENWNRM